MKLIVLGTKPPNQSVSGTKDALLAVGGGPLDGPAVRMSHGHQEEALERVHHDNEGPLETPSTMVEY